MGFDPEESPRRRMGLSEEPEKTWAPIDTYNPDQRRSGNPMFSRDRGVDVTVVMPVRGLGVLCFRAVPAAEGVPGMFDFSGVSLFLNSEIGYSSEL